jgi:hypothetical protein
VDERVEGQPFVTREHDSVTRQQRGSHGYDGRSRQGDAAGSCGWLVFGLTPSSSLHLSGCSELGPIRLVGLDLDYGG